MIGYQLATIQPESTTLHRVRATPPTWTLCGVWATTYPKVSAQAAPTFCSTCVRLEAEDDESMDDRGSDGPYSYIADAYMRQQP